MRYGGFTRQSAACLFAICALGAGYAQAQVTLTHIHGLSWSADGKQLMIPSHHGLAVFEGGRWSKAAGPQHDYMGFTATAKHYFSSGHPAAGSGMTNPFGIIRSRDGGKTWDKLGLEGETDFHLLAAGWASGAVYAWNPQPNSRMRVPGLHVTLSDGFSWKHASAGGLEGEPRALAAHPADPATVAVATSRGVYLSRDSGARFAAIAVGAEGLAVFFDLDGKQLWYGTFDGRPRLARIPVAGGLPVQAALPPLDRDAVAYIAQNPAKRGEYAIATFGRNVYLSSDGARAWKQIAARGEGK
ncbi:MAG: F510_1955 family glycosylhydrolase [Pseudomonadota bacterium]